MKSTWATLLLLGALAACGESSVPETSGDTGGGTPPPTLDGECGPISAGHKQALFGDLHVHTSYSFDAYFVNSVNDPRAAIRFAKGEPAGLPLEGEDPNVATTQIQLDRPLDFVSITDHAEFLGAFNTICELGGLLPRGSNPVCEVIGSNIRSNIRAFIEGETSVFQIALQTLLSESPTDRPVWAMEKRITDEEYEPCTFTTLQGYEFSSNKRGQMFHRNVLFRGDAAHVPDVVFSSVTPFTGVDDRNVNDDWMLWDHLQTECGGLAGCQAMTIPHSVNLSDGRFYLPRDFATGIPPGRDGAPMTRADAALRAAYDRAFEVYQHKGESECAAGVEGSYLEGEETTCDFELAKNVCRGEPDDPPSCAHYCSGDPAHDPSFCSLRFAPTYFTKVCETQGANGESGPTANCTAPLDYYQNAIAEGLVLRDVLGVNPYRQNIVASTDTHNGTPGNVKEHGFTGHGGVLENDPADHLGRWDCDRGSVPGRAADPNDPDNCVNRVFLDGARAFGTGGLAGVWAPENTREAIWDAVYRGETFGTSGPRIRIRMQASWTPPPDDICTKLAQGGESVDAASGAVMGGDLPPQPDGAGAPYITVWAMQDPGGEQPGLPLQAIDIIKGYVDASGNPKVRAYERVAHTTHPVEQPAADCSVAPGQHPDQLCVTWRDPDFQPGRDAYWYARTREIPSCRWSTYMCVDAGVQCSALDPANGVFPAPTGWQGYEGCCRIEGEPGSFRGRNIFATLEERAWASPVWFKHP